MDVLMRQTAIGFSSIVIGRRIPANQILSSGFYDQAHMHYYNSNPAVSKLMGMKTRISGKQDNKAPKKKLKKLNKKKQLKLVKGLSRDLSIFSQMGFGLDSDGLEASELVLEQLKAKQKELKKKMKREEARLKAHNCETSSTSSESSDSECGGEISNINSLKKRTQSKQKLVQEEKTTSTSPIQIMQTITSSQPNVPGTNPVPRTEEKMNSSMVWKKIEVCMGGKCKKSGGSALLEKLKRVIGIEGAVSECKCRDGPNLKVLNYQFDEEADSVPTTPSNSLCIGVGLEDVDMIVSNFHSC